MSGMGYSKTVSSKNSINLSDINLKNISIENYQHSSMNAGTSGTGSHSAATTTLDLDSFFTDNLDENIASTKIAESHIYETPEEEKTIWDWDRTRVSTYVVGYTTILSGVLDVGELLLDGGTWLASKAVGVFNDDAEDAMKEFIARDLVSEGNEFFYENTSLGQAINESSILKYDSELAQGMRNVTSTATEFAAATALTVCTGGAAAPLVVGTVAGLGKAAESTYQQNGTDTSFLQEAGIVGSGALTGLSWMANGRLGAGAINIGKTMSIIGPKDVLVQMKNDVLNKEFLTTMLKNGLASKQAIGNYVASGMMMADDFIPYITGEEEFELSDVPGLATHYLFNLGLNVLEDGARDYIGGYTINEEQATRIAARLTNPNDKLSTKQLNGMNSASLNAIYSKMTPQEMLDTIFADGQKMSRTNYIAFFKNFREHAAEHTAAVRDYAMKIANESGLSSEKLAEVFYGAQYHDLGMKGGYYRVKKGVYKPIDSVSIDDITPKDIGTYVSGEAGTSYSRLVGQYKTELINQGMKKETAKKIAESKALDVIMQRDFGIEKWSENPDPNRISSTLKNEVFSNVTANYARKNHPLNSALIVLTEDVTPEDVDKNVVALLAMSHSKSTSGIKHFDDPAEWKKCVTELEAALKTYRPDVELDVKGLNKLIDDPDSFATLQKQALSIRDGDAMSELALTKAGDTLMQTGNSSHLEFKTTRSSFNDPVASPDDELDSFTDVLLDPDGKQIGTVTNSFSKTTHAGELNVKFDSSYNGTDYVARISLKNPNDVPNCSMSSIEERIGEVVTYTNVSAKNKQVIIELPKEAQGTELGKWYERAVDGFKTSERNKTISSFLEDSMGEEAWKKLESDEQDLEMARVLSEIEQGKEIPGLDIRKFDFFSGKGTEGIVKIEYK